MATVDKNFRIKNGLVVEGNVATVNGKDILTKDAGDSYIINLIGGSADTANTPNTVVKRDGNGNFAAGTITATFVGDVTGTVSSLSNHNTDDLAEGTNLYFTNQRAIDAGDGVFDAYGAASAARTAAENTAANDATTKVAAEAALRVSGDAASVLTAANDATSKANAAQAAAEATASADATSKANAAQAAAEATASADATSKANAALASANTYTDGKVADLVDSAPALLNTLNELAAALGDSPDTISNLTTLVGTKASSTDLTDGLATKQNTLTAGSNIDITQDTISVTGLTTDDVAEGANRLYFNNTRAQDAIGAGTGLTKDNQGTELAINRQIVDTWYDAAGAAATAETNANSYTDTKIANSGGAYLDWNGQQLDVDTNGIAQAFSQTFDSYGSASTAETNANSYTDGQITNLTDGTNSFQTVNIEDVIAQRAASTEAMGTTQASVFSWDGADYRSAKVLVKVANGVHTQISELMITLDTANNVGVSEYGITYSNGTELAAISADYSAGMVRVLATPANTNTDVTVFATLVI